MTWALANDLELALTIAEPLRQFAKTVRAGEPRRASGRRSFWLRRRAAPRRPPWWRAHWGHRANILSALATLPGEDRRGRLATLRSAGGLRRRPALHPPGECAARLRPDPEQPGEHLERPGDAAGGRSPRAALRSAGGLRRRPALQPPGECAARLRPDPEQPGEHLERPGDAAGGRSPRAALRSAGGLRRRPALQTPGECAARLRPLPRTTGRPS
jgi:hypothetical protein